MSASIVTITQKSRIECIKLLYHSILTQTYDNIVEWVIVEGSPSEQDANTNRAQLMDVIGDKRTLTIRYIEYTIGAKLSDLRNIGNRSTSRFSIIYPKNVLNK